MRRILLATVVLAFPRQVKPGPSASDILLEPPLATVTTSIDSVVGLPAPHAYDDLIAEASRRYGVDRSLIRSVMQIESAFDAMAVSRAGAMGLMQLMPDVAHEFGVTDPFNPRENVMAGANYLGRLLKHYGGDLKLVLASYNAGAAMVGQYGGVPPFAETQNYVRRVTALLDRAHPAPTE